MYPVQIEIVLVEASSIFYSGEDQGPNQVCLAVLQNFYCGFFFKSLESFKKLDIFL